MRNPRGHGKHLELAQGSKVAVVGGGPAGSFASYFLLDLAERVGLDLAVDLYESKDFSVAGPTGCNNCGGIVSETLVQMLATEGINLPDTVVQRGIDSYVLHTDLGSVRIETPLHEMRIAAVHRGGGPRGVAGRSWESFDGFLLDLAVARGARRIRARVDELSCADGRPVVHPRGGSPQAYDLLVGAVGVNSTALPLFAKAGLRFRPPRTARTVIAEYRLGEESVTRLFGSSMHVFLLDLEGLEFAALIPKGESVTLCALGALADQHFLERFVARPEVRACFPPGWDGGLPGCQCMPRINVGAARPPFADRVVLVGDSAATRLYKDGIGAAYRTGKAMALTAIFDGIDAGSFRAHYGPACRRIENDNRLGRLVFAMTSLFRHLRPGRRALLRMVRREQEEEPRRRAMSIVLWDTFTGSAPYREVIATALRPAFLARLVSAALGAAMSRA